MERILIGNRTFPIKIDLNVLEKIQENYGSIHAFEMDILGLKIQKTEDGEDRVLVSEPSVKAIRTILPLMINEGLAIEAADTGRGYDPVGEAYIIQECCIPYTELARLIHREFKRCFGKKKRTEEMKPEQTRRLTSPG